MRTSLASRRVAKETASHERTKRLPQKHQKTILNFDATFAKASDKVAAVVMSQRRSLGNQKTPLLNHVSEKAATIQDASLRTLLVNLVMAKTAESEAANLEKMKTPLKRTLLVNLAIARTAASEAANLEKMKTPPQKYQKTILNFDATFAKASDVVAVVNQMTIAPVNQRTSLASLRVAKEAANHEKMETLPQKNHVMIAKIAENAEIVVILMTLLMN
jgi:hypothetical protein